VDDAAEILADLGYEKITARGLWDGWSGPDEPPPPPDEGQVALCQEWLRLFAVRTDDVQDGRTSYGLKHAVEAWSETLDRPKPGDARYLYVSNGALIEAALREGFAVERVDYGSVNARFNFAVTEPLEKNTDPRDPAHVYTFDTALYINVDGSPTEKMLKLRAANDVPPPFASLLDWTGELPPIVYDVHGVFERHTVNLLVAPPGGMKTWVLYSLGLAVASGEPWLGKFATKKTRVLLLDWETSKARANHRMKLLRNEGNPGILYRWQPGNAHDPKFWETLGRFVTENDIGLVLYDSLSGASAGEDENSTAFALPLKYAARMDVTHVFIHHAGKGEKQAHEIARGSSAIQGAADTIYRLTRPVGTPQTTLACEMIIAKGGEGDQVERIPLELSNREGLTLRREPEFVPLSEGKRQDAIMEQVRGILRAGPVAGGATEIVSRMGSAFGQKQIREAIRVMKARGEIRGTRPMVLDSVADRESRILAQVRKNPDAHTAKGLALLASVDVADVQRLVDSERIYLATYVDGERFAINEQ
jgi:RecA-family ATPase